MSYWRKYVQEVLVNRLGGLSLPRKSVVRLTDRPDMTLDVYRGHKTTMQQLRGTTCFFLFAFLDDIVITERGQLLKKGAKYFFKELTPI